MLGNSAWQVLVGTQNRSAQSRSSKPGRFRRQVAYFEFWSWYMMFLVVLCRERLYAKLYRVNQGEPVLRTALIVFYPLLSVSCSMLSAYSGSDSDWAACVAYSVIQNQKKDGGWLVERDNNWMKWIAREMLSVSFPVINYHFRVWRESMSLQAFRRILSSLVKLIYSC